MLQKVLQSATQGATLFKFPTRSGLGDSAVIHIDVAKGEASHLFGIERTKDSLSGIIGNVMQSFAEQEAYPSIEEKASHLLYFIIKNHPFTDGNKRSGAYAFVWFLRQAKILDVTKITPPALTAITLLIAESSPKDKEKMIGLVCSFLARRSTIAVYNNSDIQKFLRCFLSDNNIVLTRGKEPPKRFLS